ncbi:hypothetical protein QQ045_017730 [Rhodiola kirilowii]
MEGVPMVRFEIVTEITIVSEAPPQVPAAMQDQPTTVQATAAMQNHVSASAPPASMQNQPATKKPPATVHLPSTYARRPRSVDVSALLAFITAAIIITLLLLFGHPHFSGSTTTGQVVSRSTIMIVNSSLTNFSFTLRPARREMYVSFRLGYTFLEDNNTLQNMSTEDRPRNMSTVIHLQGLDKLLLVNSHSPPPVRESNGSWFVDIEDSVKLNSTTQLNCLAMQTRQGKLTFDIRFQVRSGHTVTCPVDVTFPDKVTTNYPCTYGSNI